MSFTLHIRQQPPVDGKYPIRLTLKRPEQADLEAESTIEFELTDQEHSDLRWYLEDYLQHADSVTVEHIEQIETMMRERGVELYEKILEGSRDAQRVFDRVLDDLADLRIEISTPIAEAASIPWELIREPQSASPIAVRVQSFVRVQSMPNISFLEPPKIVDEPIRILMAICRPGQEQDIALRCDANLILHELREDRGRFDVKVLRPPTFDNFQKELNDAKQAGRPYHIVHFDGHGTYADLTDTSLEEWLATMDHLRRGNSSSGKHGFLLFEHPGSKNNMRPVDGQTFGQLLHDAKVPIVLLNACQSAMHEATARPEAAENVHDEVRAIGSLAQAVIDQGIPAVLGMRYSVFVVTAAQYIGQLYASLAKGRGFGQAATEGRKHLYRNPDRWIGLQPRPLQDWFVPVVYEALRVELLKAEGVAGVGEPPATQLDPVQLDPTLVRYVPDTGFIGRDETLLMLDRAFDTHSVVLLYAYAGQGKTTTAVEFARWYAMTGGLTSPQWPRPVVLLTSFEQPTDLADVLNQIGQQAIPDWSSINQLDEKRQRVLQLLRQIPVLWIWDNVEPVAGFPEGTESLWTADQQRELAEFLKLIKLDRATKARVLLTSRRDEQRWLGGVPFRVQMPRMRGSDAARLAIEIGAERKLSRSEITEWQPLLDYCAGNPLTLRVIAGQAVRMGLRGETQIAAFVQAVRDGEQQIEDADADQGRDKSLGASLDYGFRNAFRDDELPIVALLHLFQGTVDADVLNWMAEGEYALPELVRWASKPVDQSTIDPDGLGRRLGRPSYKNLLDRCTETGLLTHLDATWYTIHPALPWFLRQLFARHYPIATRSVSEEPATKGVTPGDANILAGASGCDEEQSTSTDALRAWVEAVGQLGNYYHGQFINGNRDVIQYLALEEANLLHARRAARRHGWWSRVTSAMQGLRTLYQYQGRTAQWSRLVAEIVQDYCTDDDAPFRGREDEYSLVMEYRVRLARQQDRDLARAANLQEKLVAWSRQQAADAIALPEDTGLDADQRNRIRTLGVSIEQLGQILREQGIADCVQAYQESIITYQRVGATDGEAVSHANLGHAYMDLPDIRDLDAAEAAYQRSLDFCEVDDALMRSRCISQIGMVHHERFNAPSASSEPAETVLRHAQAAELHYQQALALCPATAITVLGPLHNNLGALYESLGQTEQAREHYEKDVQICEQTGDRYGAGQTRYNMALMYQQSASREKSSSGRGNLLRRAQAYAAAALRDYQHYQGRAADREAKAQNLIDDIQQALDEPPP